MPTGKGIGSIKRGIGTNSERSVPAMRSNSKVLAILMADVHLSLKPPIWRSAEPDWLEAQARPLDEVKSLQKKYACPVICAGDIFDRNRKIADGWDAPPELINFALENLPDDMYAIPGQHDLPNHQIDGIKRSAFWTLVEAGKIKNLYPNVIDCLPSKNNKRLALFGFPFGCGIESPYLEDLENDEIPIAVVHDYVWIEGYSYPNAPEEKKFGKRISGVKNGKWLGYDVVVYGDNHKGFLHSIEATQVFNCGTLMRRKSDEIDYKPQVGLLLNDSSVVQHYLDISKDKHLTESEMIDSFSGDIASSMGMNKFFEELEKLGKSALDFKEAMKGFLHSGNTSSEAKQVILDAMES